MKKFNSKSCEEIMTTVYKPIEFVVDGLLAQGLYILAGAPKVGKSWLALDMCLSIAKGEKVLGQETAQGTALYLCLEDSYARIQNRLYEITDEPTENLHFTVMSESIGSGLEEQWFCQYHLTHFIRTRIMQRERYDHSRAFFELPEAAHRWRCRFFC